MKLALIADVHGNVWALEAVLEDIGRRGISEIVNLGDDLWGPLEQAATADCLIAAGIPCVAGNGDRMLLERGHSSLSAKHLEWLREHPQTLRRDDVFCCHGAPGNDTEYLLEAVNSAGVWLRRPGEIAARLKELDAALVACGHTHIPRLVALPDGPMVVNPGSVGLPAYSDDSPFPHWMETGSPHARYAVAERAGGGWRVEFIAVPYEHAAAAGCARRNGRADWAVALETGYAAR